VLAIEPDQRRLSLGMKQLQPDAWQSFFDAHRVGDIVHGKVLRNAAFGSFVEIAEASRPFATSPEAVDDGGHSIQARTRAGS